MGHLLSHPIEDKLIEGGSHSRVSYAVGAMQGYRMTMEDAHSVKINEEELVAIFGVFDGHGGKLVAEIVSEKLTLLLFRQLNHHPSMSQKQVIDITRDLFLRIDAQIHKHGRYENVGSTAIVVIVYHNEIIVANTGDSRAVCSINGIAKTLLFDHKPTVMGELVRIENANGYIANSRINEILALSRAFGDFHFKHPWLDSTQNKYIIQNRRYFHKGKVELPPELFMVTAEPDFLVYDIDAHGAPPEFIVVACDGIWDCFKNLDLIRLIRHKIAVGWLLQKITEHVLHELLTKANLYTGVGFDNMTLIIIAIHPNQTMEDWQHMISHRVERARGLRK
ncbi:protein serine/threonine phosphatase 2C family protein [Kocuria palustris]|nr:protein serine/threonine phosphatase 2C family protein [Kocuria palustris]